MADESNRLKKIRKAKLTAFTRKHRSLQSLLGDDSISSEKLKEVMTELRDTYKTLESAHEEYSCSVGEEELDAEGDYLADSFNHMESGDIAVSKRVKALESIEKYVEAKARLEQGIVSFGTPSKIISDLSSANEISLTDMRSEIEKIEVSFNKIKSDLIYLDSSMDHTELLGRYQSKVVDEYEKCKLIGLKYMKDGDSSSTVGSRASRSSSVSGDGLSSARPYSTTKRETVMLPHFSGDEKTAYLKYPIWKKQWDTHIQEYEDKYRSTMLLNHLDEKAQLQIVGLETDYEGAIEQLDSYYVDAKKVIKACLDEIRAIPIISQFDYKSLVNYKKVLLNNHARLKASNLEHEMSNTAAMGVLIRKFPIHEAVEWQKYLADQSKTEQNNPFPWFVKWLEKAGQSWELLAASGTGARSKGGGNVQVHHTFYGDEDTDTVKAKKTCFKCGKEGHLRKDCTKKDGQATGGGRNSGGPARKPRSPPKHRKFHCAFHKDASDRYCSTWSCPSVKYAQYADRIKLMKENLDCEICCGDCPKGNCSAKVKRVCGGGKDGRGCGVNHVGHELWCAKAKLIFTVSEESVLRSSLDDSDNAVLLQVMKIPSFDGSLEHETALWDSACTGMFVRNEHAENMGFSCKKKRLRVITLGGDLKEIDGVIYDCKIRDLEGNVYEFSAHGLDNVTGNLSTVLDESLMRKLFPNVNGVHKMGGAGQVDYLIGLGKASWQPERFMQASGGGDFWIWRNKFGSCVGGSHPLVGNFVDRSESLYTVLKVIEAGSIYDDSLKIPTCTTLHAKTSIADTEDFFKAEQLCTVVEPKCGSCRCGKCPVPGSRYSHKEEAELKLIDENLHYDENEGKWIASYPFLFPKESLKGSKSVAVRSLLSTEKMLSKNMEWGKIYDSQIQDMLDRGAARHVPASELMEYTGHINYLPHLAVRNPKSDSTPVRIVFDASRAQGGGPSLNAVLAKGPDRYLNNLADVIIRFRNGAVAVKGDVKKMYNSVGLEREDSFLQCFLWRNLDPSKDPETFQVVVNNIGVKPAGCIATLALYKSSEKFQEEFPVTAVQLKSNSYVDDLGLTGRNREEIRRRTAEADKILAYGNMKVKRWVYSGDKETIREIGDVTENLTLEDTSSERMLGINWDPADDVFKFSVRINLSTLKKKTRAGPDLTKQELLENPPKVISRRQYYSQIQSLFDPLGFLAPVLLKAKILLRKTWDGDCGKLGWDQALPGELVQEMVDFFLELFDLENIVFPRSLVPKDDVDGKPDLVIFSDGSVTAYGSVAYIRWKLVGGDYWTALILSKSKIAPRNRITIPRLELNGAVLSKRLEEFVRGSLELEFNDVFHLVDSSTVLGYVHKADSKLKPFEGIRVSEIQAAGRFVQGRLHNWSWVDGDNNPADWTTKPRSVSDLEMGGVWQRGPDFLRKDVSEWPIRLDFRTDTLEGELCPKGIHMVLATSEDVIVELDSLLVRFSSARKLYRILGYMLQWRQKIERGEDTVVANSIDTYVMEKSKRVWVKYAQKELVQDLMVSEVRKSGKSRIQGRFSRLAPFEDETGVWRVGKRLREYVPFTEDHRPPALLPRKHRLTKLLMEEAHSRRHGGIADTVATFRLMGYWAPHAAETARLVKRNCVICRYLDHHPIGQIMGNVPPERLLNPVAWGQVELDLFGPFTCRSDVNKRASKKVWGIVIIDANSSATHCDIVLDYSAHEVINSLRRFASLRGWPSKIASDPGSQLQSASGELKNWWSDFREEIGDHASSKGFEWEIRPADSPWRQGKSEVSIKKIKRLLKIAVGDIRLTPTELQTALYEIANLCNEKPVGMCKMPDADGTFAAITPNCLLLGRSSNSVTVDSRLGENLGQRDRLRLINQVTTDFWSKWTSEVTPLHVVRQKWHQTRRNLQPGDLVLVHDSSVLKGKYTMAIVDSVVVSTDGLVRSCKVSYRIPNSKDKIHQYTGGKLITLSRSVQKLTLLLGVEEQNCQLVVSDGYVKEKMKEN